MTLAAVGPFANDGVINEEYIIEALSPAQPVLALFSPLHFDIQAPFARNSFLNRLVIYFPDKTQWFMKCLPPFALHTKFIHSSSSLCSCFLFTSLN